MASLPDGTAVSTQFTEGFNISFITVNTSKFTISASQSTLKTVENVTLSGDSQDSEGNPAMADLIRRDRDGNETTVTTIKGSYSVSDSVNKSGTYEYFLRNDLAGIQATEKFSISRFSGTVQWTEGFNEA